MEEFIISGSSLRRCKTQNEECIIPDGINFIDREAFVNNKNIKSVKMPDTVMNTFDGVFKYCENLERVELSKKLNKIENYMFQDCFKLKEIIGLENIEKIFAYAFSNCLELKEFIVSNQLKKIDSRAFYKCINLERIIVSEENEFFKSVDGVLYNKDLTTLVLYPAGKKDETFEILDSVKEINNYAFQSNSYLKKIVFNDLVTTIPEYCFTECSSLEEVIFNDQITKISQFAFKDCRKISFINFPKGLNYLSQGSFENCINLQNVILPEKLYVIDFYAFSNCTSLKNVEITSRLTCLNNGAFKNCISLEKLTICKSFKEAGENIFEGINKEFIIEFYGTLKEWQEITKTKSVCVSHPSINDFRYYGNSVDEYVPTVYEDKVIISDDIKYKLICKEQ